MSGYTIHLGLLPEHSQATLEDLRERVGPVLRHLGFFLEGDCLSVWCETSEDDPSLHVPVHVESVTWDVVQEQRRHLNNVVHGHGYRVMDYAFVTDREDWSKDSRTWLLTEQHSL